MGATNKIALLGVLLAELLLNYSGWGASEKWDIDFDTAIQIPKHKEEEFIEIQRQLDSSEPSIKTLVKYLKLWPSFPILSLKLPLEKDKDKLREEYDKHLTYFFYNKCSPIPKTKFQEAKIRIALANSIRAFNESTYTSQKNAAARAIKPLILDEGNTLKEEATSEALYWAWKYREHLSSLSITPQQWMSVLSAAAYHLVPSAKAQYTLGRLLEEGSDGLGKDSQKAKDLFDKAAKSDLKKAQLYQEYTTLKSNNPSLLLEFFTKLADQESSIYPYARYMLGEELWSQRSSHSNAYSEEGRKSFSYLLSAARNEIQEAQQKLDQIHGEEKDNFYKLCRLCDNHRSDEEQLEFLKQKADQGLMPYAYQLAQMYEDGKGVAFTTPEEWLASFEEAKRWYDLTGINGLPEGDKGSRRIEEKINLIKKARGYILNKIRKGATVSFSPNHPLFEELSEFINVLYQYSPGARYLGACIVQQILEASLSEKDTRKILEELSTTVESDEFKQYLKEEEPEAEQAVKLFEHIIKANNPSIEKDSQPSKKKPEQDLASFLAHSKNFIFNKIKAGIEAKVKEGECQPLSPNHPLFGEFCTFIDEISRYEGSIPEHGAHLVQQLLYFPPQSLQAKVLITSLIDLIRSKKFQEGEGGDSKEDIDDYRVEKLAYLNQAIELTRSPRKLLTPLTKDQEEEIPEKLKVNTAMFRDPRIQVFNYYFEQEGKPFDQAVFDQSVEAILKLYDQVFEKGKVTQDMLLDKDEESSTYRQYGERKDLKALLTNGKSKADERIIPNRFGHRLIKIAAILESGALDEDGLAAQLSAWAVAGLNCATRSENETCPFYNRFITEGKSQENENDTLEMKVAIILANFRRQLLHKFVREADRKIEPLHKITYLENNFGKKLGLYNPQVFDDPHEQIVPMYYKNLRAPYVKGIILDGDGTYQVDIEVGKGYRNPDVLIEYVLKELNQPQSPISFEMMRKRFEDFYGSESYTTYMSEYYNGDIFTTFPSEIKMTPEGIRALLFSLGYLEEDLGVKKRAKF